MKTKILKSLLGIAAATALSGCMSLKTPMTDFATDYNRVIADTRNEMILLNIVRARYGEPTHYSALSQVGGNLRIQGAVEADIPGIIDDIDLDASTGVSVASSPSFTLVPLTSADFSRGILRTIEPQGIALFVNQGWNDDILAPLFIESIQCGDGIYANDPRHYDDRTTSNRGKRYLSREQIFNLGFEIRASRRSSALGEPIVTLRADDESTLETMLEQFGDDYRVEIQRDDEGRAMFGVYERTQSAVVVTIDDPGLMPAGCNAPAPAGSEARQTVTGTVNLRSVEGVIYFLGEVLRGSGGEGGQLVAPPNPDDSQGDVIFRLWNAPTPLGHSIHVSHNGSAFFVARPDFRPGGQRDRSIQVISLINQLIGLQTSDAALERPPSTLTIN